MKKIDCQHNHEHNFIKLFIFLRGCSNNLPCIATPSKNLPVAPRFLPLLRNLVLAVLSDIACYNHIQLHYCPAIAKFDAQPDKIAVGGDWIECRNIAVLQNSQLLPA
jgi:hypothetical protein